MKINFKQPRYVLPLILLPFLCLFFYAWKSSFGKDAPVQQNGNTLQETVVDVSEEVKNKGIEDKLTLTVSNTRMQMVTQQSVGSQTNKPMGKKFQTCTIKWKKGCWIPSTGK
jgi:hypothetical protein